MGGYIKMYPKEARRNSVDWINHDEKRDQCEYGKKISGS
jgi:hypothetical protein